MMGQKSMRSFSRISTIIILYLHNRKLSLSIFIPTIKYVCIVVTPINCTSIKFLISLTSRLFVITKCSRQQLIDKQRGIIEFFVSNFNYFE